jgi:hypothetical protein
MKQNPTSHILISKKCQVSIDVASYKDTRGKQSAHKTKSNAQAMFMDIWQRSYAHPFSLDDARV